MDRQLKLCNPQFMWILELYTIQSMLKPENKNHNEMRPCIKAAADTVKGIAGTKIED